MCGEDEKPAAEPAARKSLLALPAALEPLDEGFPPIAELPLGLVDL